MGQRIRLLLADDHHLVLQGLTLGLQDEFEIIGQVGTGTEAVRECRRQKPDVLLLDLGLPDKSGLDVITDLHEKTPEVRIVVVTMYIDRVLAEACLRMGALAFVPKDAGFAELRSAIHEALAGRQYISRLLPETTTRHFPGELRLRLELLTPRQRDIVRMLGQGKSTAGIAARLNVSAAAITFHRGRIRKILKLKSEWDLMRFALLVNRPGQDSPFPQGQPA